MGSVKKVPIIFDVDMTVTSEYQQYPMLEAHEEGIRAKLASKGLDFKNAESYFRMQDELGGDNGITYLMLMMWDSQPDGLWPGLNDERLREWGRKVKPAEGLVEGLTKLKKDFEDEVDLRYFFISVGVKPMIEGFMEANGLEGLVDDVAASTFTYGDDGTINGINSAVTSFGKNEWLISFIKGDANLLNKYLLRGQYMFDYRDMVVVGDGYSDTSKFSLAKKRGGTPVVLYEPGSYDAYFKAVDTLRSRADYFLPRDFTPGFQTFNFLKEIVERKRDRECLCDPRDLYAYRKGDKNIPEIWDAVQNHLGKCNECQDFFRQVHVTPEGTIEEHRTNIRRYEPKLKPF